MTEWSRLGSGLRVCLPQTYTHIRSSNRVRMRFTLMVGGGHPMPTYEYLCKDCRDLFEKTLTLTAHAREPIACPKCGSKNVEQELTTFYAVTSKKSA